MYSAPDLSRIETARNEVMRVAGRRDVAMYHAISGLEKAIRNAAVFELVEATKRTGNDIMLRGVN